ncbi:MAG: hypothetical protein WBO09_14670 [Methylocystis silviterrae]|uniref:hypothetical protein n=1 Tax=Methylocystis silviterrae TaxID=2743612 RepID=UPI003C78145A
MMKAGVRRRGGHAGCNRQIARADVETDIAAGRAKVHGPKFALLSDCNVESIRDEAQAAVNRRRHIAHLTQKIGTWRRTTESELMSIFGNIGTFFTTSAQGVVEAVITLFQSSQPNPPGHRTPINTSDTLDYNSSSGSEDLELATIALASPHYAAR